MRCFDDAWSDLVDKSLRECPSSYARCAGLGRREGLPVVVNAVASCVAGGEWLRRVWRSCNECPSAR